MLPTIICQILPCFSPKKKSFKAIHYINQIKSTFYVKEMLYAKHPCIWSDDIMIRMYLLLFLKFYLFQHITRPLQILRSCNTLWMLSTTIGQLCSIMFCCKLYFTYHNNWCHRIYVYICICTDGSFQQGPSFVQTEAKYRWKVELMRSQ